jgi:nucleotide-binding universal stress UspA family protein
MAAEGQPRRAIQVSGQDAVQQEGGGAMTSETNGQELVVVGVDGSAESVRALSWAARYAAATGARVQAVLAWHYPAAAGQAPVGVAPDPVHKETEARERAVLDETIAKAYSGRPGPAAEARLGYGHPAQVLIEASKEADLLVVAHRGHGAFTGMLLGSVSIHCVTGAFCPVVVVRGGNGG